MPISPALAAKLASAKTSKTGINIADGDYVLAIKKLFCLDGHKGQSFIGEFEVIASEPKEEGVRPNQPGTECSVAFPIGAGGDKGTAAMGNTKQLVCAVFGIDEANETAFVEALSKYVGSGSEDPAAIAARGRLVEASTFRKKVQRGENAGKMFTFPAFTNVAESDGNTPAEIASRRAQLEGRAAA